MKGDVDLAVYPSPDTSSGEVCVAIEVNDHLIAYLNPDQAEKHAHEILAAAKRVREYLT